MGGPNSFSILLDASVDHLPHEWYRLDTIRRARRRDRESSARGENRGSGSAPGQGKRSWMRRRWSLNGVGIDPTLENGQVFRLPGYWPGQGGSGGRLGRDDLGGEGRRHATKSVGQARNWATGEQGRWAAPRLCSFNHPTWQTAGRNGAVGQSSNLLSPSTSTIVVICFGSSSTRSQAVHQPGIATTG
jgi:hypothetical protein